MLPSEPLVAAMANVPPQLKDQPPKFECYDQTDPNTCQQVRTMVFSRGFVYTSLDFANHSHVVCFTPLTTAPYRVCNDYNGSLWAEIYNGSYWVTAAWDDARCSKWGGPFSAEYLACEVALPPVAEPLPVPAGLPHLYSIRGRAMEPSILSGETALAWKSDYGWKPKRGDVVIFAHPHDGSMWSKRVVGLPGEKIQVQHGRLIINGEMVPREPTTPFLTVNHFGKPEEAPQYLETLPGGVTHRIIQIDGDDGTFDNTKVYEVPPGHYFMMGDNRDNSSDSRLAGDQGGVGYVPYDNIVAKVTVSAASARPDGVGATVR
jgi:signal peptidase I